MPTYADRPVRIYDTATSDAAPYPRRIVRAWLFLIAALVLAMAVVGAATRLTGSGLSITEWQPIVGTLPPLTDADWEVVFEKYRQIPQYQQLNRGMSLAAFKDIFWWEWGHRFLGRAIGVVFLLPFLFFWARGWIPKRLMPKLVAVFALGGLQGFVGWYMVQSGLVGRVDVSQYRLAMHLSLAAFIFAAVLWLAFELGPDDRRRIRLKTLPRGTLKTAKLLLALIFVQIALGALVAGMKAGLAHNTWPLMDGKIIPTGLTIMEPWWRNAFENALTVQFDHRILAYVIALIGLWHAMRTILAADDERVQISAGMLTGMIFFQIGLGVWTLLSMVPLDLALAHQAVALVLLGVAVWHVHSIVKS
jgi:cytochrome c oxidase assembly protein subunit 15